MPMTRKAPSGEIRLKRVYEPAEHGDGARILVDRLWPRGVKKTDAAIDRWLRDIAPSAALRQWFAHRPERWPEFRRRYRAELRRHPESVEQIRNAAHGGLVTLVYAARDEAHNNAVVLRDVLSKKAASRRGRRR
jgi:uncharacterized protein YeaO (DUF488 family)